MPTESTGKIVSRQPRQLCPAEIIRLIIKERIDPWQLKD